MGKKNKEKDYVHSLESTVPKCLTLALVVFLVLLAVLLTLYFCLR